MLRSYDFRSANLRGANLQGADLRGANFRSANFRGANLLGANLRGANLRGADLRGADLSYSDLRGADLRGADLRDTLCDDANIEGAHLPPLVIASTGPLRVYKRVRNAVLTLYVPREAMRTSCIQSRKCRVEYAKVISANSLLPATSWHSLRSGGGRRGIKYRLGHWVYPDNFDADYRHECTHGIHVFTTYEEALAY